MKTCKHCGAFLEGKETRCEVCGDGARDLNAEAQAKWSATLKSVHWWQRPTTMIWASLVMYFGIIGLFELVGRPLVQSQVSRLEAVRDRLRADYEKCIDGQKDIAKAAGSAIQMDEKWKSQVENHCRFSSRVDSPPIGLSEDLAAFKRVPRIFYACNAGVLLLLPLLALWNRRQPILPPLLGLVASIVLSVTSSVMDGTGIAWGSTYLLWFVAVAFLIAATGFGFRLKPS